MRQVQNLASLDVCGCTGITDASLAHVGQLKGLASLGIESCKITGAGLQHLRHLPNLASLKMQHGAINDAGCLQLGELQQLTYLDLSYTGVTDAGFSCVGRLLNLTDLSLRDCDEITGAGLTQVLTQLQRLASLDIGHRDMLDDAEVAALCQLPSRATLKWRSDVMKLSREPGSRLFVVVPWTILIQNRTGTGTLSPITIFVHHSGTVDDAKARIQDKAGILPDQQHLVFANTQRRYHKDSWTHAGPSNETVGNTAWPQRFYTLDDGAETLQSRGIRDGSTLCLVNPAATSPVVYENRHFFCASRNGREQVYVHETELIDFKIISPVTAVCTRVHL